MYIKINKALLDPNFISLVLWSKTRLNNQHIRLGLLWNWRYAITYKTKHNSWINIFGRDKIMINSPEVHFIITREQPKVGHKNKFILGYKINS
jgi:hypothetical protein